MPQGISAVRPTNGLYTVCSHGTRPISQVPFPMTHLNWLTIPIALTSLLQQFVTFPDINCFDSSAAASHTRNVTVPFMKMLPLSVNCFWSIGFL